MAAGEAAILVAALLATVAAVSVGRRAGAAPPAIAVADTAYAIPGGAMFVSPSGSDANPGTATAPFATLARAIALTPTGGTIVMRGGTYHESINAITRTVTIQAYPHEQVWLDGRKVVTGWSQSGSAWVHTGWNPALCQTCFDPKAILSSAPAAGLPDMAFIDGVAQQQVASAAALAPGTFYVDVATHTISLGSDPSGHVVQLSDLAKAMQFATGSGGSAVRGIGVVGYASAYNPAANAASVIVGAPNITLENDTIAWSASRGLAIFAAGVTVRGSSFFNNGFQGLVANNANNLLIDSSRFGNSNAEHFVYGWSPVAAASGAKITNSTTVMVRDSVFSDNAATGLWFDLSARNVTVVRNLMQHNLWDGLAFELTDTALIASNVMTDNGALGLKVSGSTNIRVWNNTIANNASAQLGVYEDARSNTNTFQRALGLTWDTANVAVHNNVMASDTGPATLPLVHTYDNNSPKKVGASQMISSMDDDVYARSSISAPKFQDYWVTMTASNYATSHANLGQFQSGTGYEPLGVELVGYTSTPLFVDESHGDYHLTPTAPARGAGRPLPSDIAAAVGVAGGVAVDRGALTWPAVPASVPTVVSVATTVAPTTTTVSTTTTTTAAPTTTTTTTVPPTTTTTTTVPPTTTTTTTVPPTTTTTTTVPAPVAPAVYGLWNKTTGDRIYTISATEVAADTAGGYTSLGILFHGTTASGPSYLPVYRLVRSGSTEHLYTPWTNERNLLVASAKWSDEGTPFMVSVVQKTGLVPVYRFYDLVKHSHYLGLSPVVPAGSRADGRLGWVKP